jgi:hypothetical protein
VAQQLHSIICLLVYFLKGYLLKRYSFFIGILLILTSLAEQQVPETGDYILGEEETLQMDVHIWGQVRQPGEFRVTYDTNLMELISKAGGPTEFAALEKVRLTRESKGWFLSRDGLKQLVSEAKAGRIDEDRIDDILNTQLGKRMIEYNLSAYLKDKEGMQAPPQLKPGDVVYIPQNTGHKWREIVRIAHEVAVIASVYVWYLRATDENW